MDLNPYALARILLPHTPSLLKTAFLHSLSLTPTASKQDLRTSLTVSILRQLLEKPNAIGKTQRGSLRDPGIKGKMWIAKVNLARPEGEVKPERDGGERRALTPREAVGVAIRELGENMQDLPETMDVEAEWTGYRGGVDANAPRLDISEGGQYKRLMEEVKSDVTILYFHGGAHIAMDPCSHRIPTARLARLTSGRVLSVRYRLSPQHPFPSALLDTLIAYLSLLSPAPGSFHPATLPQNIVLAGDSAGGNLCLALVQLILSLHRLNITTLRFHHGRDMPIPLPAGLALNSPWCDISRSMPSSQRNARYDYIAPPVEFGIAQESPPDDVWPARPPRLDLYVQASALIHPLVSPLAATSEMWQGAPPTYMCIGNEALEDEAVVVARRMHEAGVQVRIDGYEGMPHCFGMIFAQSLHGKECMRTWAGFITNLVEGRREKGQATWAKAFSDPVRKEEVLFEELQKELTDEKVERLLKEKREKYLQEERRMVDEWRREQGPEEHHQHPSMSKL